MAKSKVIEAAPEPIVSEATVVESVTDLGDGDPYLQAVGMPSTQPQGLGFPVQKPSEQVVDEKLSEKKWTPDPNDTVLEPEKWIEKHLRLATGKDLRPRIWQDDYSPGTWRFEVKGRETMIGIALINELKLGKPERTHGLLRGLLAGILPEYRE